MRFIGRWKYTIGFVIITISFIGLTLAAFLYGWSLLGLRNGWAVFLMIYGYTAFTKQMEAVGKLIATIRKTRK